MKMKLINGCLLFVSMLLLLLLSEIACRIIITDGKEPANNTVTAKASPVVAIGDSQTYGMNATLGQSWPANLQNMADTRVYNLSYESYGPVQYYRLLKHKALKLDPDQIIVGYYIGNDLMDAFDTVYNHPNWKELRSTEFSSWLTNTQRDTLDRFLSANTFSTYSNSFGNNLHAWLIQSSMLYRQIFHSSLAVQTKHFLDFIFQNYPKGLKLMDKKRLENNTSESINPVHVALQTEISNKKIQEGLRITLQLFERMNERCEQEGIKFTVLFIPTKEMVYCHYLYNNRKLRHSKTINNLLNNERIIREISIRYFMKNNINFVDALPLLQRNIDSKKLYSPASRRQPNNAGYYLIAKSVFNNMQEDQLYKTSIAEK